MDKILVTGGKGFIGKALVQKLRLDGNFIESFDLVNEQNLGNLEQVMAFVKGKKAVFHLAAVADLNWAKVHPIETMKINIEGTWNIAYACYKQNTKLYYASTCCVYGNQEVHPVTEESLPNPSEIYACTKLAGENVIIGFHHTYGLQYNIMRFATIYGAGCRPALGTHIFLGQALRGEPITVHGNGKQTRTLTHISDLIDGILALYKSGKMNNKWNLTNQREISANEMAATAKHLTGSKSKIVYIPERVGQTFKEEISAEKMRSEIGWVANTAWENGIAEMLNWFIDTNQSKNIYQLPTG